MTASTLYNQYQEGKITKNKFLYEIKKQNLPYITFQNSFNDIIKILKNKSIITEKKEPNPELPKVICHTIDMVSPYEYSKGMNFELKVETQSFGQNTATTADMLKAQKKVLRNLTKNPYYYSKKLMTDEEKKYEKNNEREYELKKQFIHNNKKGIIRENIEDENYGTIDDPTIYDKATKNIVANIINDFGFSDQDLAYPDTWEQIEDEVWMRSQMNEEEEDCSCDTLHNIGEDKEIKNHNMSIKEIASKLVNEWNLNESDLEDEDILSELHKTCNTRYKESLNEMEDEDKGVIEVDDEVKAKQLADDGVNVKLKKDQ